MWKLRLKLLVRGHSNSKWKIWVSNPGCCDPHVHASACIKTRHFLIRLVCDAK